MLAPIIPSKVVAVGRNYAEHAQEMGGDVPEEPVIFLKPSTAVIGPDDPIPYPRMTSRVDHEAELGVVFERADQLWAMVEDSPKSRSWKLRDRIGERKRWYELPEEVG